MAYPDEPQSALSATVPPPQGTLVASERAPDARLIRRMAVLFAAALLLLMVAYLAWTLPGGWFPSAQRLSWTAAELAVTRGQGVVRDQEVVAIPADASGLIVISLATQLRSSQYPVIAWDARGIPEDAHVRLLWRTDYAPAKMNAMPVTVSAGRLLPVAVHRDPAWLGNVLGLALAIQGSTGEPVRIRGLVAAPMGAREVLDDRLREWFGLQLWSGTSINTIAGGTYDQALRLPALLFAALALTALVASGVVYRRGHAALIPAMLAAAFLIAWSISDVRWAWNLVRQVHATVTQYAGKSLRERHLVEEDGQLYAFIEHVRAKLPDAPVRIVVAAEANYLRGRAAYHLYPNNVYFEPYANTLPDPDQLRSGDYMVVFRRRDVQFDQREQRLRWDGKAPVRAELLLVEPGAALFRLL
ncbi:MAG: hypothetical protein ABI920_14105 [Casimicrobiaceae bacterium]